MNNRIAILLEQAQQLQQQKHLSSAAMYARKVLKKEPANITANKIVLSFAQENNDVKTIETCCNTILNVSASDLTALQAKLKLFELKELHFKAIALHEKLEELLPKDFELAYRKALSCLSAGKILAAEKALLFCADQEKTNSFVYLNLGHVYKAKGNLEFASKNYQLFIRKEPKNAAVGYWSLADLKDFKFSSELLSEMFSIVNKTELSLGNRALMLFALARAYEQHKDFEKSFQAMNEANQILAKHRPFKAEQYAHIVKSFIAGLPALPIVPQHNPNFAPIFIVGMPRSGTTLVEQILASHSSVESTDELPFMERIALEMEMNGGYVSHLAKDNSQLTTKYSKQYLEQVGQYFEETPKIFIDKNPNNFLHIALILKLFPQAKIINVVRDPLDNAMSVFKQHFSNGHDYSYSLLGIAFYWQGYLSLMFHWKNLFKDKIYHLSYEKLVANPEQQIRDLLHYCKLDFEAQCLTFYESKRVVLTPSVSQVQQPINNKSVGSWKKYEKQLTPALAEFSKIRIKVNELLSR